MSKHKRPRQPRTVEQVMTEIVVSEAAPLETVVQQTLKLFNLASSFGAYHPRIIYLLAFTLSGAIATARHDATEPEPQAVTDLYEACGRVVSALAHVFVLPGADESRH